MSRLPLDVISDVFCRLPVKSVVRFKCLSKPCCSLIEDADFVREHLNHSGFNKSNLHILLRALHLYSVDFDALRPAVPLHHPFFLACGTEAFGSCNGLIALRNSDKCVALYNPSTRSLRTLPASEINPPGDFCKTGYVFYGFGQDVLTKDYKVVRMATFSKIDDEVDETSDFEYEVKVYSLKNDCWKRVDKQPYFLRFLFQFFYHLTHRRGCGVLACGVLHWVLPPRFEVGMVNKIVGFDLATEEFIDVPIPDYADQFFLLDVGVLEGCLCAVCNIDHVSADVWIMKEYGKKDSWTRLFSIQTTKAIEFLRPLAYSKDRDKILLEFSPGKLVWYDLKTKRMRTVRIQDAPDSFNAQMYVGSLISPDNGKGSDIKQDKEQDEHKKRGRKKRDDFLSEGFKLVL